MERILAIFNKNLFTIINFCNIINIQLYFSPGSKTTAILLQIIRRRITLTLCKCFGIVILSSTILWPVADNLSFRAIRSVCYLNYCVRNVTS